ncbi:hypothetical protein SAMN06269185_1187 [Natronoarchaeum philippinense]|uniref:Uncharacterized protein n=1 Tax=Natronoarchaeum philippinense TaxID=558529 RepID=A0A285NC22_NATPI|nr:hypothetical protein [Natronoarchaeum philippinense]SNZ06487.1 hypothetical protein SAMN06269185_1187 [Natronoarchaeum philippinense]
MPNPSLITDADLARTYHSGAYEDPYERIEDYRRVIEYAAEHPNRGSQAIATALELPRGRIRPWVDSDAKPDPMRGVEAAERNGWLRLAYDDPEFRALNRLVAWVFSGGSIAETNFTPKFTVESDAEADQLRSDFETLGVEPTTERDDDPDRATELRPTEHGTVLGRVLHVLGAPVAHKNPDATISLPAYLDDAPDVIRRDFVDVYLSNRAVDFEDKRMLQVTEQRSSEFLNELAALFEDVSGESVNVSATNVYLSAAAAEALCEK